MKINLSSERKMNGEIFVEILLVLAGIVVIFGEAIHVVVMWATGTLRQHAFLRSVVPVLILGLILLCAPFFLSLLDRLCNWREKRQQAKKK